MPFWWMHWCQFGGSAMGMCCGDSLHSKLMQYSMQFKIDEMGLISGTLGKGSWANGLLMKNLRCGRPFVLKRNAKPSVAGLQRPQPLSEVAHILFAGKLSLSIKQILHSSTLVSFPEHPAAFRS